MQDRVETERRADAVTSGSAVRPARDLRSPRILDLEAEASALFDEPQWDANGRNALTIASSERMRITLTAVRGGTAVGSEGNDDTLSIQVLRGAVRVDLGAGSADVRQGQLATMVEPGPWRLHAIDDALLLLTVATGPGRAAGG